MDKILKPDKLRFDPNDATASKQFKHWKRCFENYVTECVTVTADNAETKKLQASINTASSDVYEYIDECTTYTEAMAILQSVFVKSRSEIYARHKLATAKQAAGQSLEDFRRTLNKLSKDCNFKAVSAAQYKLEMIRDAFINGLLLHDIRRRLLEEKDLTFDRAFELAVTYSDAKTDAQHFELDVSQPSNPIHAITSNNALDTRESTDHFSQEDVLAMSSLSTSSACYFCGSKFKHNRRNCKARDDICNNCGIKGHWAKACKSPPKGKNKYPKQQSTANAIVCAVHNAPSFCLSHAIVDSVINGRKFSTLVDTGSSKSYIDYSIACALNLKICPSSLEVGFAQASVKRQAMGICFVDLHLNNRLYKNVELYVLKDLCSHILLGKDFQQKHKRVVFELNGPEADLVIKGNHFGDYCAVAKANIQCPPLFNNLTKDCKPVATKSRRHSKDDMKFIGSEVQNWLKSEIVRPSFSPWRAQPVVVKYPETGKRWLCIDYSQTINLFTELDAYPIPRIEDIVNNLAGYQFYATSAHHQVPIKEGDVHFTAFEAAGTLYEFVLMPFGVKNGGPVF